jgi:tetratricopeptide (TPR) repeat protein
MNRGTLCYEQGDLEGAVADFGSGLQRSPDSWELYRNRGMAHFQMRKIQEAIADFSRSLQLRPNQVDTLANRAQAFVLLGKLREAVEDNSAALRLKDDPILWVRRSRLRGMLGEVDGAIEDASQAIRGDPGSYDAYASRGFARMTKGDRPAAAADFARALELAPPAWPQRGAITDLLKQAQTPK